MFQPQRLLYDNVVDEDFPVTAASGEAAEPGEDEPPETGPEEAEVAGPSEPADDAPTTDPDARPTTDEAPETYPLMGATGHFVSRSRYTVTGEATVYEFEDGSRTLRLEDLHSTNGPDLFVYLTTADADDPDAEIASDHLDLGALRGNVGDQNYDIPASADLDTYDTVVIWCRPFSVAFGAADLS
ncbi:MAG: DM13 domain-containing protein [Nitriliruptoraceae bacterium]